MARVLIIGYGNPLRGDDRAGRRAAEELRHKLAGRSVEILTCHQLTPELAASVSESDLVLFVDAQDSGPPGTVRCSEVSPQIQREPFSHQLSAGAVLGLAKELYGKNPLAFAFSISGEDFETKEGFSPPVEKHLPELIEQVAAMAISHQKRSLSAESA